MPLDPTANRLRYLILGIQAEGERALNAALQDAGTDLTATRSEVLEVLAEQGAMSQSELAGQLVCTKGNISRLLDRMQAKGLLRRDPDPESRRRVVVRISDEGREAYRAAEPVLETLLRSIRALYDRDELATLTRLLGRLADAFEIRLADHVTGAGTAGSVGEATRDAHGEEARP